MAAYQSPRYHRSRRHRMRRGNRFGKVLSWLISLGFGALIIWTLYSGVRFIFSGVTSGSTSAQLNIIKGRVKAQLAESSEWIPTLTEQKFFEGDALRTESNTQASIEILGTNTIFLDQNTEVSLKTLQESSSGKTSIHLSLQKGQIWVKVSSSDFQDTNASTFFVESPRLGISVKGTAFNLQSTHIQDTLQLIKGEVEVVLSGETEDQKSSSVHLGVGQKIIGNQESFLKIQNNQDIVSIVDNDFLESDWNLQHLEQFYPQDAAQIKRRIELNATRNKPAETPATPPVTLEAPRILTPENGARVGADREAVTLEGTAPDGTQQIIVNGYTLTKYLPGSKKWQYFASRKFGTMIPGENTYTVVAVSRNGERSPEASVSLFYEGEGSTSEETTAPSGEITIDTINDFIAPIITSPAIFQINPEEIYQTSASVVTLKGTVDPKTNAVEVNGFRLKKFEAGDTAFSYIANANYNNMAEGENNYTITAFGPDNKQASTTVKVFYSPIRIGQ